MSGTQAAAVAVNAVEALLALATTASFVVAASRTRALLDVLLAVATAGWLSGQVVYLVALVDDGQPPLALSWSDPGFLVFHLLAPVAMALTLRALRTWGGRARVLIDGFGLTCALLAIAWMLGLSKVITQPVGLPVVVQLAYPVSDVFTIVVIILATSRTNVSRAMQWLAAGLGVMTCAEATAGLAVLNGHAPGFWPDAELILGQLLVLAAGVHRARPAAGRRPVVVDRATQPAPLVSVLPYLPLAFAAGIGLRQVWAGDLDPFSGTLIASMILAVLVRQGLLVADNSRLLATLAEHGAQLHRLAHSDPLTGLANRRALADALEEAAAKRSSSVLLFADLDGFKAVNDRYGHDVGDALLQLVAARLSDVVREDDLVARVGGDEFALLCHGPVPPGGRAELEERVHATVADLTADDWCGPTGGSAAVAVAAAQIGVSVGSAELAEVDWQTARALRLADERMYVRKRAARSGGEPLAPGRRVARQSGTAVTTTLSV